MTAYGLHLNPFLTGEPAGACSVLAEIDDRGILSRLDDVSADSVPGIVAGTTGLMLVDQPLAIPDGAGRRDVETVLAWLDHPTLPVSRRRMEQLHGGVPGEGLAQALAAERGLEVAECLPDLVLRQIVWEQAGSSDAPVDLAAYREAWLGCRAPRFRGRRGAGASAGGVVQAWRLLASVVDLAGWAPVPSPTPAQVDADAARVDAVACAYAAHRALRTPERSLCIGTPERGRLVTPADAHLTARAAVHLERLRGDGAIRI